MIDRQRLASFLPVLACFVVLAVLQVPGLFLGYLTWDERLSEYIPWRVEAARLLAGGEFPFFTDKVFGGMPLFATAYVGVLYPPNWAYLLFPPTVANWLEFLHGVLAASGMYLYLRGHRLSRGAALLGGGFFLLLLFHGVHAPHVSMREAGAFAPLVAWSASRLLRRPGAGGAALLAALIAVQWFIGYAQLVLFTLVWLGVEWILRFRPTKRFLVATILMGGAVALGCCLAMVQIFPAMALVEDSARQQMTLEHWQAGSFPPQFLPILLQPLFVDMAGGQWGGADYAGEWVVTPLPAVVLLALVPVVALFVSSRFRRSPRRRMVVVAVVGMALTLLLALGSHFPPNRLLFHIPPFNMFRIPSRWLFLFGVCTVVCAAVAVDWLGRMGPREKVVALGVSAVLLALGALFPLFLLSSSEGGGGELLPGPGRMFLPGAESSRVGERLAGIGLPGFGGLLDRAEWGLVLLVLVPALVSLRRRWFVWAAPVALLALSLQWFQVISVHVAPPADHSAALVTDRHPLLRQVDPAEIARVYAPSPDGGTPGYFALLQNSHLFHGIRGLHGYCPLFSGRMLFSFNINQLGVGWRDDTIYDNPAMPQSAGVSHLVIEEGRLTEANRQRWEGRGQEHYEVVATHLDYKLARLREPVPRYHLAREWRLIHGPWEAEEDIWNPSRLPVSEEPLKVENPPWRLMPPANEPLGGGEVAVLEERASRVLLGVRSQGPGVLVIRDVHWPGWRWRVVSGEGDGEWHRVQRAQSALRYLPVPVGDSVIEVVYRAPKFQQGRNITLASLAVYLLALIGAAMIRRSGSNWVSSRAPH